MKKISIMFVIMIALMSLAFPTKRAEAIASDDPGAVTAATVDEVKRYMADPTVKMITFIPAEKGSYTIPKVAGSDGIQLSISADGCSITNKGTFKLVRIFKAKKFSEKANGNTIDSSAKGCSITVNSKKKVKSLKITADTTLTVKSGASVGQTTMAKTGIKVTVKTDEDITLTLKNSATPRPTATPKPTATPRPTATPKPLSEGAAKAAEQLAKQRREDAEAKQKAAELVETTKELFPDDTVGSIRYIHDQLCILGHVPKTDDWNSDYGIFLDGSANCNTYSTCFKLCMDLLGVENHYVGGIGHGWNRIKVDGVWYHVDVTKDDTDAFRKDHPEEQIIYSWFMLTDDEFDRYTAEGQFEGFKVSDETRKHLVDIHTWDRSRYEPYRSQTNN